MSWDKTRFVAKVIYKNSPNKGEFFMANGFTKFKRLALRLDTQEWYVWFEDMDKRMFEQFGEFRKNPMSEIVKLVPVK